MIAKYKMTQEQNIFVAKRNLVDYIYNSAKLEGCNVTFPETQTILAGVNVGSVTLDDIQTVLNLRDAWRFVLAEQTAPFDLAFICKVNEQVSRNESLQWGALRTGQVGISGTEYKPPLPEKAAVEADLQRMERITCATERAIAFFLWACRAQLFWDGNKRTATLCANKILIAAGEGVLSIRDADVLEFNQRLLAWYDTGDPATLDAWMYAHCIDGLALGAQ
ncbi:MAG: Fic family protein [Oscillospiraceae bacterium]|jgi:Fic family protein|nr:Fic family protein [Oscillospiraceae bacterium]